MYFLRQLLFLIKLFIVLSYEIVLYLFFRDYNLFLERATDSLSNMNILYVKIFQAIALNNSLINSEINNKLLKFTDNAPIQKDDIDYNTFDEIQNYCDINILDSSHSPVNSGMISLVYRGIKRENNMPIIIKIKRKNIEKKLKESIDNLLFITGILKCIPLIKKYQIIEVVERNIDIIQHQVNFKEEVKNIIKIKNNCKNLKYIKIPHVYESFTLNNENVIIMEEIYGMKINELKKDDYTSFAKQVIKFGCVTTLLHGFAHGDLHSGNILFIKEEDDLKNKYKLGILDFGIMYELDEKYRENLLDISLKIFTEKLDKTALTILKSGLIEPLDIIENIPKNHYNNIIKIITKFLEDIIIKKTNMNQIQIYKFISKFTEYINCNNISNLGLKPSDNLVKTQLVLAMAQGVTLTLCKDYYLELFDMVIQELFHTNILEKME